MSLTGVVWSVEKSTHRRALLCVILHTYYGGKTVEENEMGCVSMHWDIRNASVVGKSDVCEGVELYEGIILKRILKKQV
jgi:hypothetical protein